jgi:hypothetical protein
MGAPFGEGQPVDSSVYTGDSGQQGTGGNPAWQEFLEPIPQELHEKVRPVLEKWDKGVQDKFNTVHQQYEPWKPIIDAGVDPDTANFALNLLNSINENPEQVWKAIGEYYKLSPQGTTSGQGQQELQVEEDPYDPRISTLERQNQIMAAHLVKQQEDRLAAQAEAQLDQELSSLRTKYKAQGDFSEQFVLAYMQNGFNSEDAVKAYYEFRDAERAKFGQKPLIMGSGGGVPQFNNTDVRKLDESQTKNLVVQMLQRAAAERNQ